MTWGGHCLLIHAEQVDDRTVSSPLCRADTASCSLWGGLMETDRQSISIQLSSDPLDGRETDPHPSVFGGPERMQARVSTHVSFYPPPQREQWVDQSGA